MTSAERTTIPGLLGDFRLLLILFVVLRGLLLVVYQPLLVAEAERGITVGGDYRYYYDLAAQAEDGLYPFRDWWSEFPPLWAALQQGIYTLAGGSYGNFAALLGLIMLGFDLGILLLVRAIGTHLHGANTGLSLAWIYTLLLPPLVFTYWTFEPLPTFLLFLGLYWLLRGRDIPSAVAVALGTLTKFVPALLIGAVVRFRPPRRAAIYIALVVGFFALPYIVLLANPNTRTMTAPSLTAQFNKASYQTVWALLDGNMTTGIFGSVAERTDPANAIRPRGEPSVVPGWLRFGVAAAIGLFVFMRARRTDGRGLVSFTLITLLIFYLQSQGWSPQWTMGLLPLALLVFPTRNGVYFAVMLSVLTFADYPTLFIRTGDTGGNITGALVAPFVLIILLRTLLLTGLAVACYRVLRQRPIE